MHTGEYRFKRAARAPLWLAVCLLLALFAQAAFAAARLSLTTDEGLHITSGYSILRTGDFRLIEEHPPLVKMLAALPLLLVPDLPDPRGLPGWESDAATPDTVQLVRVMKHWLQPYRPFDGVVYAARVPIILLSLLLGAVVFRWAADLAGSWAGVTALALYAFDPNILAHSSVAAIDLGATACIFFASYTFWRALRRPSRVHIVMAGVTLGLAQAVKISAVILIPQFIVLAYLRALTEDSALFSRSPVRIWIHGVGRSTMLLRVGLVVCMIFALALVSLWAVYGFEFRTPPGWHVPIPAASHLIPLKRVLHDTSTGRTTFLMGQYSERGWWYYFPVAFAIKTPLPTLIFLAWALGFSIKGWVSRSKERGVRCRMQDTSIWWNLGLFPVIYFGVAIFSSFNIGYRHLLPILPFIFVFIAVQVTGRRSQDMGRKSVTLSPRYLVTLSLLVWCVIEAAMIWPHDLAYFNEVVGGPDGGYRYLVDSNLDWGQAWKELKAYMDAHGIARVKFAQFSSNDPATYGIEYEPIAPMTGAPPVLPARFNPAPGVYVLSASSLQGVPLADVNTYDYFRHRQPAARIGHALFVYDVRPVEPSPGWVALCAVPVSPLEPPDIIEGFGRSDLRLIYFDCQQNLVIPGDTATGWIVLPYALAHTQDAFISRWLEPTSLVFEQRQSFALPPHSIFFTSGDQMLTVFKGMVPLTAAFGETVELEGYALDRTTVRPGQSVELLTLWRVIGRPPAPLSIMAHLTAADGQAIAVGDGLGFTADQWQVGDVFIQRSLLHVPSYAPPGTVWVQTGLYTLGDIRRLSVTSDNVAAGDSLQLAPLSVQP